MAPIPEALVLNKDEFKMVSPEVRNWNWVVASRQKITLVREPLILQNRGSRKQKPYPFLNVGEHFEFPLEMPRLTRLGFENEETMKALQEAMIPEKFGVDLTIDWEQTNAIVGSLGDDSEWAVVLDLKGTETGLPQGFDEYRVKRRKTPVRGFYRETQRVLATLLMMSDKSRIRVQENGLLIVVREEGEGIEERDEINTVGALALPYSSFEALGAESLLPGGSSEDKTLHLVFPASLESFVKTGAKIEPLTILSKERKWPVKEVE